MSTDIFSGQWNKLTATERKQLLKDFVGGTDLKILYLDDESSLLEIVGEKISDCGFSNAGYTQPDQALEYIKRNRAAIVSVISDFKMPSVDGFTFRQQVQTIAPEIPFIILSGYVDRDMALRGLELKIAAFIEKPVKDEEFFSCLTKECLPRILTIREEWELLKGFTDDASNLIEQVEELTLELEENPNDQEAVSKIFGMIHTIKGSSGFFEPRTLHSFAHRFEDTLKDVQSGRKALNQNMISLWLKACDILKTLIDDFKTGAHSQYDLEELTRIFIPAETGLQNELTLASDTSTETTPADAQNTQAQRQKGPQELKVSVTLLDEFMQTSGEMTVIRNMINKIVRSIEKQYPSDKDVALLSELLGELHKVNGSVQAKITEIRKVPVKSVVKPLTRIIRDTSQALKKEVDLKLNGDEIRIDTSVAEVLSNSLIHLIRNSLDHGIETPEARAQAGKSRRGEVKITTSINGEAILVEIEDDGKGINPDAIRQKLVSNKTHTSEQVQEMNLAELYQMIFSAGFSTAQEITDISGRGVGMSMVKDVVEAIGGKILIDSHLGKGTKFSLNIPIPKSVLITNCLFVTSQNMQFGVPQDQIRRVINVEEATLRGLIDVVEGANILRIDEQLLPIVYLKNILNGEFRQCPSKFDSGYLVILSIKNNQFCLWVDSVLDVEDTVVKTITAGQIKNLALYMGATFLGDGTIGLILNVEGIAMKTGILGESAKLANSLAEKKTAEQTNQNVYSLNVVLCELQGQRQYAVPLEKIFRLEEFQTNSLQYNGKYVVAPYRNRMITFVDMERFILDPDNFSPALNPDQTLATLVLQHKTGFVGMVVNRVLDLVNAHSPPEEGTVKQPACQGWLILGDRSVTLIEVDELLDLLSNGSHNEPLASPNTPSLTA
jgi:two-component system chemotaxis sensor kinase CheA